MIAKDFLLIECTNLRSVLKETLGYNFGIDGTKDFYTELTTRLDFIEQQINGINANDVINLQPYPNQLIQISTLISRIERSCLGEYSWPFVTEFKKIAAAIWAQNERIGTSVELVKSDKQPEKLEFFASQDESSPPMMFVLSEGGLAAYAIGIEQKKASATRLQILTIQFPRTLKHFVLLHPILGHELGHALYKVSKFSPELDKILNTLVQSSSKFNSPESTKDWIYDDINAPNDYKISLVNQSRNGGLNKNNFLSKIKWASWKEEILCDLIGLLIFGPSYLAALITLLHGLDTSGYKVKPKHPLTCSRINLMLTATKFLGYDNLTLSPTFEPTARLFWEHMESNRKPEDWYNIFTDANVKIALDAISSLLGKNDLALYPTHTSEIIEPLVKQLTKLIPPVGYKVDEENGQHSYKVDFRHILYAGWLALEHKVPDDEDEGKLKKFDFGVLNRLCEHGIMQQIAIDLR